jgi:uridine kinase
LICNDEPDQAQPMSPAKRILILGPSGSGKSTLARQIAERLRVQAAIVTLRA